MQLTADDVLELVRQGEGRRTEFKRGLPQGERVARTLCAFANTSGGILMLGVDDAGRILGVPRPRELMSELRAVARELVEPPLAVELALVEVEGVRVLCCSVPLSGARPHAVLRRDGSTEIVVRAGSSNRVAQGATLRAIELPAARGSLDALERRILAWVAERSGPSRRPDESATVDAFARAHNVGRQRAKRAFLRLEREGRIVGHGPERRRAYATP